MTQRLRALVALAEVSSTHLTGYNPLLGNFSYRESNAPFWPPWAPGTDTVHIKTDRQNNHKHKFKIS